MQVHVLFPPTTSVTESTERGAFTPIPSVEVFEGSHRQERPLGSILASHRGCLLVPPPQGWGSFCLWHHGEVLPAEVTAGGMRHLPVHFPAEHHPPTQR